MYTYAWSSGDLLVDIYYGNEDVQCPKGTPLSDELHYRRRKRVPYFNGVPMQLGC